MGLSKPFKMQFLEYFYFKNLKFDLYNKFNYGKTNHLPQIKKIILNFGCKTTEMKRLAACLLALELITQQKGVFTNTKYPSILLKLKEGNPVGCKITLRKKKMFFFLEKIIMIIFPKAKNFRGLAVSNKLKKNSFSYDIIETLSFNELEPHYYLFHELPKLNITFVTNTKTKNELIFLLDSFQLPIKKT